MSTITRAFTKRSKRLDGSAPVASSSRESASKFSSSGTIRRGKISGPVQLLSTTNMLAYDAPDLPRTAASAAASSSLSLSSAATLQSGSGFGSDASVSPSSSVATPTSSPGSVSSAGTSPVELERNHLSGYFPKRASTVTSHPRSASSVSSVATDAVPPVPKRAPSHTKRSHQELARQRSMSQLSGLLPRSSLGSARSSLTGSSNPAATRDSVDAVASQSAHPFGKELAQVSEVAEEFAASSAYMLGEEELLLERKGLFKFTADEYLVDIDDLYKTIFGEMLVLRADVSQPSEPSSTWV